MSDLFELPLEYKGEEILLPAQLLRLGYTHKISVTVSGTAILFEPDEERNYRAVLAEADRDKINSLPMDLLPLICQALNELFGE